MFVSKKIGIGCSCIVFRAYQKDTKEEVAIKLIDSVRLSSVKNSPIINEISLLKSLNHPNIVQLVSFSEGVECVNQGNEKLNASYLGLEYLSQGELFLYISRTGPFNDGMARFLFHQLIEALEYIHQKGVYHKDIKPENLMFSKDFQLKLVDFGFAITDPVSTSACGTTPYMLPEIFKKEEYESGHADLFAAGVVLFNLLTQRPPFMSATPIDPLYNLLGAKDHTNFWKYHKNALKELVSIPDSACDLLNSMLALDPSERSSISEIKDSEWYQGPVPSLEEYQEEMIYRRKLITYQNQVKLETCSTEAD